MRRLFVVSLLVSFPLDAAARECGTSGTIAERVASCEAWQPWVSPAERQVSPNLVASFTRVSRLPDGEEIWRDDLTGDIWLPVSDEALTQKEARQACQRSNVLPGLQAHLATAEEIETSLAHGIQSVTPHGSRGAFIYMWTGTPAAGETGWVLVSEGVPSFEEHHREYAYSFRCVTSQLTPTNGPGRVFY